MMVQEKLQIIFCTSSEARNLLTEILLYAVGIFSSRIGIKSEPTI